MIATDLSIDFSRLKKNILELSDIGKKPDHGIYRMAFSDEDMKGRSWLKNQMRSAGLSVQVDGAGNISGKLNQQKDIPTLVIGSHIDTVPCAGALDGTLGVLVGLECLRTIQEAGVQLSCPLEVVSFSDEEGRFGGMFGSQSFCGRMNPDIILSAKDLNGVHLAAEMERQGFEPMQALEAARDPATIKAYLELHIEQGPVLDNLQLQAGIVTEITGLFKWAVKLKGMPNHAGTTPMDMRKDAFMGLADFAHEIPRVISENGSKTSRATIGKVELHPGSPNTVPGEVEFSLDVRDISLEVMKELHDAFRKALSAIARERDLIFDFETISWIEPVACNDHLIGCLEKNAQKLKLKHMKMPSGAAHDAQILGRFVPSAMIFVPSKEGYSHSPAEWTSWTDIEAGANLMLQTILDLAEAN